MREIFRMNTLAGAVLCAVTGIVLFPSFGYAAAPEKTLDSNNFDEDLSGYLVYGKSSKNTVSGHHLNVSQGAAANRVFAALSSQGDAVNNSITVQNLMLDLDSGGVGNVSIIGAGFTKLSGNALKNFVVVSNTTVHDVYGGRSNTGSAKNNTVKIHSGVQAGLYLDKTDDGQILTKSYGWVVGGLVQGGSGEASENKVVVDGLDIYLDDVLGGQHRKDGVANQNVVEINDGHLRSIYGGNSYFGDANNNTVLINGGLIAGKNKTDPGSIVGGEATNSASGNRVEINAGQIIGSIVGGSGKTTDDNTIIITGRPNLAQATLIGGTADQASGNTLIVKTSDLSVRNIEGFQNLEFFVSGSTSFGSTLLSLIDTSQSNQNSTVLSDVEVGVQIASRSEDLSIGDEFVLLNNLDGIRIDRLSGSVNYDQSASILNYDWALDQEFDSLVAKLVHIEAKPETKSIVSANLSRIAFVNQGSDLLVGQGIVAGREAEENGRHLFVALQTGSNHYNIDSYIDLEGESVSVGSVWPVDAFGSKLTLGGFVESGWGDYEVENALTAQSAIKGQGETHYRGAGLLAYWSESPLAEQGLYAEASMRLGRADISYQSVASSLDIDYDVKGTYWAGHVGLGYRHQFNDENYADLYTKFFYSHQDSDAFVINRNTVQMDTIESMRWRTGLSYRHRGVTPEGCVFDWQAALAYEYEFDGKAKGSIDGYRILESELQGSTGIGEVSITFLPSRDSGTRVRASLQGFVGAREGYVGQIQWTQTF